MSLYSPILQIINEQNGLSNFKLLIDKWEKLSDNIKQKKNGIPIILPDIFLISKSGWGKTHCLKLLAEYLSQRPNLMDFYGDVKCFEFLLNYCQPDEYFSEIQRLMAEIDNAAGFRNTYRGIICIDIDEWRGHCEEKHFLNFMEYLADNSDDWLVVLSVSDENDEEIEQIETIISAFLRIEQIVIEAPQNDELMKYVRELLSAYGLSLSTDAEDALSESIETVRGGKYFDGYKTVKMICRDIAYLAYANGKTDAILDLSNIKAFAKDSEYIQRMIFKIEKVKKIGFC